MLFVCFLQDRYVTVNIMNYVLPKAPNSEGIMLYSSLIIVCVCVCVCMRTSVHVCAYAYIYVHVHASMLATPIAGVNKCLKSLVRWHMIPFVTN